jgi:hypothetical protein
MAQYRTDKKIIDSGQVTTRYEVMMLADQLTTAGSMVDAFGRLRTSQPHTLFDNTFRFTDDTRNWSIATTGAANTAHSPYASSVQMNVGTTSGDKVVRQTSRYFHYQPGKSLLVINSFCMQPKANVRQRVGYFDTNTGFFLEHDGTTAYIVKRTAVTGLVTELRIPQSEWSEDAFDGTGYSKITLDFSKSQIQWMDIEWLGAGTTRMGFVVNGVFYTAHKFHHANLITSVYITSASLPIRYEIENTGATASNTMFEHICNTVISEGGHTPLVSTRSASTPLIGVNVSNTTDTPVIAIRLKSDRVGGVAVPVTMNLYGIQSTPFRYTVTQAANVVGGTWVTPEAESHVEYNITPTSYTGGKNLLQGMFTGGTGVSVIDVDFKRFNSSYQLRTNLDGSMDTFLISVIATTNNDDAVASITWEEYN